MGYRQVRNQPVIFDGGADGCGPAQGWPGTLASLCIWRGRVRLGVWRAWLGHEQQFIGSPGGFGGGPSARLGHGRVLDPMGERADRRR
jgi:hypothetical protein